MITVRREIELLIFIFVAGIISMVLLSHKNATMSAQFSSPKLPNFVMSPLATPTPTPPSTQNTTVMSPDGSETLVMKKQVGQKSTSYSFSILTKATNTEKSLFMKTTPDTQNYELPANSWSPDSRFIFIKETTLQATNYYVLSTTDDSLNMDTNQVNIQTYFSGKYPNYSITDVTGWAAPDLIVVNTKTDTGGFLSFWFYVPNKSFIPLGTQFH